MRDFLEEKIYNIYEDFKEELSTYVTCCDLKDLRFNGGNIPDYSVKIIQQLYLLRYFVAYTIEYYRIYKKLVDQNFLDYYNVLSIGAGCGLDYYGLYFALQKDHSDICYTGLDRIDWNYRESFGNEEYYFENIDINDWSSLDWDEYNVIMFPKSIGEFDNQTFEGIMDTLKESNFNHDKICLISSVREQNDVIDTQRLVRIANVLEYNHNYSCLDKPGDYRYYPNNDGFAKYYPYFSYPPEILELLLNLLGECSIYYFNGKACRNECSSNLNKWPMLRDGHVKFQVVRLER